MKRLRFLEGIKHIKLAKSASYALMGAAVVLIGTFAAWQFTKIFSPSTLETFNGVEAGFNTSDHDASGNALPNLMADPTVPDYSNPGIVTTLNITNGGLVELPRIQGEIIFK